MLNHAFFNMNLNRVKLTVIENNKRAINLYEKNCFVYEGRKRKARYKGGKYIDMLMYAVLRDDFSGGTLILSLFSKVFSTLIYPYLLQLRLIGSACSR